MSRCTPYRFTTVMAGSKWISTSRATHISTHSRFAPALFLHEQRTMRRNTKHIVFLWDFMSLFGGILYYLPRTAQKRKTGSSGKSVPATCRTKLKYTCENVIPVTSSFDITSSFLEGGNPGRVTVHKETVSCIHHGHGRQTKQHTAGRWDIEFCAAGMPAQTGRGRRIRREIWSQDVLGLDSRRSRE